MDLLNGSFWEPRCTHYPKDSNPRWLSSEYASDYLLHDPRVDELNSALWENGFRHTTAGWIGLSSRTLHRSRL